jgi:hypothetical protein
MSKDDQTGRNTFELQLMRLWQWEGIQTKQGR